MLFKRIRRTSEPITNETISIRAYELWQARGCPHHDGHLDWQIAQEQLQAEQAMPRFPRIAQRKRKPLRKLIQRKPLRSLITRIRNRRAA